MSSESVARMSAAISGAGAPHVALLMRATRFNPRELSTILKAVAENRDLILRAWHDHFGN